MSKEVKDEWIDATALLFYQIFSVDYKDEKFENKLLQGGGGNSTLCSTWVQLSDCFIGYRISKGAYELLISLIKRPDRDLITKEENSVIVSKIILKKYNYLFSSNAKGAENRKKNGQYFHFDHNPSNKKVLMLLKNKIKDNKDKEGFLKSLSSYIKKIQTVDLIMVEEDDLRTQADLKLQDKLDSSKRDEMIGSEFYDLIIK